MLWRRQSAACRGHDDERRDARGADAGAAALHGADARSPERGRVAAGLLPSARPEHGDAVQGAAPAGAEGDRAADETAGAGVERAGQVRAGAGAGVPRRSGAGTPRSGMPAAPSEGVADRVRDVAGAPMAVAADGRAAVMRPYGEGLKVYLYREPVDMRKWRNGLAALAQEVMKVDPFSGALLIFVGKYYNAVKILYWHRNGFAVWHAVIEGREKFCWPRLMEQEVVTLTAEELAWLLDGYDIFRQPHK